MEEKLEVLDLSGQKLKKLNKPTANESQILTLNLDDNELQRLDNVDSYVKIQKLTVVRNQLLRMYGVCRLHTLHTLNLSHNGILTIEGIKDLINLKTLCLAGNSIKVIEHLNSNVNLEHLDLSENCITHINDLSFLKNLQELYLHCNKIAHLRQCDRFLPSSLTALTLASNNIGDLNEISQLVHLTNLNSISISNNPCVNMSGNAIGFDYRPFIINWCMSVRVIDGYVVDAIESLRAEWLYSQGRGRHFRKGEQQELVQYLATVCPLTGAMLETEEDRKLRLILSKAQHHQQQLREQSITESWSPSVRKRPSSGVKVSPKLTGRNKNKSPDRMSSSYYNTMSSALINSPLMTQSLDPSILSETIKSDESSKLNGIEFEQCLEDASPLQALSKLVPVPESLMSPDYKPPMFAKPPPPPPVTSISTMQKVETTKSPRSARATKPSRIATVKTKPQENNKKGSPAQNRKNISQTEKAAPSPPSAMKKSASSEDESEICAAKLQTINLKVEEKKKERDAEMLSNSSVDENRNELAAIFIQKMWRGYKARNKNKEVQELYQNLQSQRANQYIQKLVTDVESTKVALESERRIQMLQMQAINALWKRVSTIQGDGEPSNISSFSLDNTEVVKTLAQTCNMLYDQVQQLQGSMQGILRVMSIANQIPMSEQKDIAAGTQTEISAVHTPQGEAAKTFPFQKQTTRPSSLPLPVNQRKNHATSTAIAVANQELKQFAGSLVEDVIKTVAETKVDHLSVDETVHPALALDASTKDQPSCAQTQDLVNVADENEMHVEN